MLPFLKQDSPFPEISLALDDPNGLLAAGGDLSVKRLLDAYQQGIFPWYSDGEPILWWSPNPRTTFIVDDYSAPRSLKRWVNKTPLKVTLNQAFAEVVRACAEPRGDQDGTWITEDIELAYINLHLSGFAHSVEVWQDDLLVGGIYGVSIGKLFCGESMFSRISNASKLALSSLIGLIRQHQFPILDCQVENPHLMSLGAENINRQRYIEYVARATKMNIPEDLWRSRTLDHKLLLERKSLAANTRQKNRND